MDLNPNANPNSRSNGQDDDEGFQSLSSGENDVSTAVDAESAKDILSGLLDAQESTDEIEQMGDYNDRDNIHSKGQGQHLPQFDAANTMSDDSGIDDILTLMRFVNVKDSTDRDLTRSIDLVETSGAGDDGSSDNILQKGDSHDELLRLMSEEGETNNCEDDGQEQKEKQSDTATSQGEDASVPKYNGAILGRITEGKERKLGRIQIDRKCKKKHSHKQKHMKKRKKESHGCNTKCISMRNRRRRLHKSRKIRKRALPKLVRKRIRRIYRRKIENILRNDRRQMILRRLRRSLHHKRCHPLLKKYCQKHKHHKRRRHHKKHMYHMKRRRHHKKHRHHRKRCCTTAKAHRI